jgi:hypothetical protein
VPHPERCRSARVDQWEGFTRIHERLAHGVVILAGILLLPRSVALGQDSATQTVVPKVVGDVPQQGAFIAHSRMSRRPSTKSWSVNRLNMVALAAGAGFNATDQSS